MLQKKSLRALMHLKHLLSIATYLYATTGIAEAYVVNSPSYEAPHAEHDVHKKDTEDAENIDDEEDHDDEEGTQETEEACAQAAPTSPAEEPESKELQQEKALYEMNAYFDDYLLPRPFIIGSTEF